MYDAVADLPLTVEEYTLERHERETSSDFTRVSTEVVLRGAGATGRGEDVTYEAEDHDVFQDEFDADLAGEYAFEEFSDRLDSLDLWPRPPERETSRAYRRWAFESAALDLALRQAGAERSEGPASGTAATGGSREQAGENLGSVLGRSYDPVRFVVSTRLPAGPDGDPATDRIHDWLERDPGLEFKLDPTTDWDDAVVADLAATDAVRVLEGFPDAVIEDPKLTVETRPVVEDHADRLSWDFPVHGVEDVEALPFEPEQLNCKPSRFGTVASLFEFLEYCEREGIALYGGGQFELGVGRGQIQVLASLCYPDAPNDVAPGGYNDPEVRSGLPATPLDPPAEPTGFRSM